MVFFLGYFSTILTFTIKYFFIHTIPFFRDFTKEHIIQRGDLHWGSNDQTWKVGIFYAKIYEESTVKDVLILFYLKQNNSFLKLEDLNIKSTWLSICTPNHEFSLLKSSPHSKLYNL